MVSFLTSMKVPQPIIEITDMTKSFPGVKALDNISYTLMKVEVHALLEEKGAGKTIICRSSGVAEIMHVAGRILDLINGEITAEYSRGVAQPMIIRKLLEENH
jgi:ABC-type sugar transport system ATPase subunit